MSGAATVPKNPSRPSRPRRGGVAHVPAFARLKGEATFRLSLRFTDPEMETRYSVEKEKQSGAAFGCSCVVLFFTALVEAAIDPW